MYWGEFSGVQAILLLIRQVLETQEVRLPCSSKWERIPVKEHAAIFMRFLEKTEGWNLLIWSRCPPLGNQFPGSTP